MTRLWPLTFVLFVSAGAFANADDPVAANRNAIRLVIEAESQPDRPRVTEPEVLDFRYAPSRWQTCIGLVDDPRKTIVGDDGGLYYDYGGRGPEPYNNGQGTFGTRVLAQLVASEKPGPLAQSLYSPRVPIVISRQQTANWDFLQEAWSDVVAGAQWNRTGQGRIDYLSIKASNRGSKALHGQVFLNVGASSRLILDRTRTRLLVENDEDRIFCQFSRPCEAPADETAGTRQVHSDLAIAVQRNWAQPNGPCAACFRDVLIGFSQPLDFQIDVTPGEKRGLTLGFVEGWHSASGKRPLRIEIEGRVVRTLDLVREFGKNVPVVLPFFAEDGDRDGVLRVRILSVPGADDGNTIISGLWVFPHQATPPTAAILEGRLGDQVIAQVDANHMPDLPAPHRLTWETGTVAAGDAFELLVALPLDMAVGRRLELGDAAALRQRCIDAWQQADLPYDRLNVPDQAVQGLLDSCIRNIYQAREWKDDRPKFQVGPTCYRGTWAADGPFLLEAVSYLGRVDEARAGLEQQVDGDDGPSGVEFSKKSGLRLWMIWRHFQLTGDQAWLRKMWPRVEREVNQIIEYRSMTRDDPKQANCGLMPIGFGDGGLGGKHREYTNVYWTLAGLKAAIEMAEKVEHTSLASWRKEYADYWEAFDRARNRDKLTDDAGNTYVPVTMQGEQPQSPQRGAWAFLQSIFPGRIFDAEDALMRGTMDMLDANEREGLIFGTGWIPDGIWNYAASFYAHAHLWLGDGPKAAATLYAFGNHASPLLCWREEQNPVGEAPHFVGDMPHNWGSAEFIRLVRHLVILERSSELHLFEGLPRRWTRPGSILEIEEVPTSFGDTSVRCEVAQNGRTATITVDPPRREPVSQLVLHVKAFNRPVTSAAINGVRADSTSVLLPTSAASTITLTFEDAPVRSDDK